jgi:hypothetical protein
MKDDHEDEQDDREHEPCFDSSQLAELVHCVVPGPPVSVPFREGELVVRLHPGQGLIRYSVKLLTRE